MDPSLYSSLQWRNIGPQMGGRSLSAAGNSARPNEYSFGATGGGLWKTTNGGNTWARRRWWDQGAVLLFEPNRGDPNLAWYVDALSLEAWFEGCVDRIGWWDKIEDGDEPDMQPSPSFQGASGRLTEAAPASTSSSSRISGCGPARWATVRSAGDVAP